MAEEDRQETVNEMALVTTVALKALLVELLAENPSLGARVVAGLIKQRDEAKAAGADAVYQDAIMMVQSALNAKE